MAEGSDEVDAEVEVEVDAEVDVDVDAGASGVLETRHLRSALEFAVLMAHEGRKFRPPLVAPDGLHRYATANRITSSALESIRRVVEGDPDFRRRIAHGALPELVDPVGIVWLRRPDGWEAEIGRLIAADEAARDEADIERRLKRVEKRRAAAEQVAARAQAEIVALRDRLDALTAELAVADRTAAELRDEADAARVAAGESRTAARHAEDRAAAAGDRADRAQRERDEAVAAGARAATARDAALGRRVEHVASSAELAAIASAARRLTERLDGLVPSDEREERRPLPIPGGLVGTSIEAAEYLFASGASILVDGYNVGKSGWPDLTLAEQRALTVEAAERLARRFGADLTVVFDGADVVGAHTAERRTVRVVYSGADELADDVLRSEVERLPSTRNVIVVTNDREVIGDVRARGANTVASEQLIAASA